MNNLKTKVDDLNVGKFSVDLKKVTDVADNEVVKNTKLNTLKTKVSIMLPSKRENLSRCSTKLIHVCEKIRLALDCGQSKYSQ